MREPGVDRPAYEVVSRALHSVARRPDIPVRDEKVLTGNGVLLSSWQRSVKDTNRAYENALIRGLELLPVSCIRVDSTRADKALHRLYVDAFTAAYFHRSHPVLTEERRAWGEKPLEPHRVAPETVGYLLEELGLLPPVPEGQQDTGNRILEKAKAISPSFSVDRLANYQRAPMFSSETGDSIFIPNGEKRSLRLGLRNSRLLGELVYMQVSMPIDEEHRREAGIEVQMRIEDVNWNDSARIEAFRKLVG